ncbi:flagellar biosynthetic protein FliR [Candidatus Thiodiazotropha sp. CDECU1]|uniref:flagellar biosynthetic protein FliR n=1 Tax=Candidatus Thiodiazotropha sp. CDECU1 TaxID=3065865 RepID=UPI00292D38EA|nr:flagellar biosynthetic protein FliR [Candidatus Thiodiazotropha sp. CDECU1]
MLFDTDTAVITTALLVATRFSPLFLLTPLFAITRVPARVRVLLVLALSALLVTAVGVEPIDPPATLSGLMYAMMNELILGMLLAFGLFTAFGAFLFGGRIIDFQMGFGVANLIDPATQSQAPMLGTVLNLMAVMTFFLLDGHHLLIRGLVYSLQKIPPGSTLQEIDVQAIIAQFGVMFVYGLAVVAPVVAVLLMLDVGMAVAARTMPQVNMFIVGFPLKIFMGLLVLALSLNYMGPLLEKIYASIFHFWQQVYG